MNQIKPNPTMQPCKSSQVKAHGHCAATNTLCVEYASGGCYHYHDVSSAQYAELSKAESVGKYLNASVNGKHKYTKQDERKA